MGQKINPIGLRLGINRTWDSRWYAERNYGELLHEDIRIRKFLQTKLAQAGVSKVVIERPAKKARVTIHTARPGVVIGRKGQEIENLRREIDAMTTADLAALDYSLPVPEFLHFSCKLIIFYLT